MARFLTRFLDNTRLHIFLVIVVATLLRTINIYSAPASLYWDEVSTGYNAYSLLHTGLDEYGNSWPISIRSFNDYKPPLYTYLAIPSIAVFGLNTLGVRLPSIIAGIVAVGLTYALTHLIFKKHKHRHLIALTAASLLAISPWHLQFSRPGFEANVALASYLGTIYFYLLWLSKKSKKFHNLLIAVLFAGATMYSYHSARLVLPLMLAGISLFEFKKLWRQKSQVLVGILLGLVLIFPFMYTTFFRGSSLSRLNTVSFLANKSEFARETERYDRAREYRQRGAINKLFHNERLVDVSILMRNYSEHFNLDFLFVKSDTNPRHSVYGMGLLYLFELPLLLVGLFCLINDKKVSYKYVIWLWILLGPIPSAITESTPHAIRSFLMIPALQIIESIGLVVMVLWFLKRYKNSVIRYGVGSLVFVLIAFQITYYLFSYHVVSPYHFAPDWQYAYPEMIEKVEAYQEDYGQVVISNHYDQPQIYFAFYQQIPPREYQQFAETAYMGFDKYIFKRVDGDNDKDLTDTLLVVEPRNMPEGAKVIDTVEFPNGDVAFNFVDMR